MTSPPPCTSIATENTSGPSSTSHHSLRQDWIQQPECEALLPPPSDLRLPQSPRRNDDDDDEETATAKSACMSILSLILIHTILDNALHITARPSMEIVLAMFGYQDAPNSTINAMISLVFFGLTAALAALQIADGDSWKCCTTLCRNGL